MMKGNLRMKENINSVACIFEKRFTQIVAEILIAAEKSICEIEIPKTLRKNVIKHNC